MVEIYKISHLSLNEERTTLSLCYNHGVRTYSLSDFKLNCLSNNSEIILGDISMCNPLHEMDIIVFTGTEKNETYSNKSLVIYDMKSHAILYKTTYENPIVNIKSVSKYIYVSTGKTINVYSFNPDFSNVVLVRNFFLENDSNQVFNAFLNNNSEIKKIYFIRLNEVGNCLNINSYFENDYEDDKSFIINTHYKSIQNFFYLEEYKLIFIVENDGKNFCSYTFPEGKKESEFYRGKSNGIINNIIAVYDNYIAVSNLDHTIHLFKLHSETGGLLNFIHNIFTEQLIYSCMKIRLNDIVKETKFSFFDSYFHKNGALLYFDKKKNNFIPICYNGFAYVIKINFLKMTYEILEKINFINENLDILGNSVLINNMDQDLKKSNPDSYQLV